MIQRFLAVVLSFAFAVSSSIAMADAPKAYIEMEPGFFSQPGVMVNGKRHEPGLFKAGFGISESMRDNSEAYEYARKHESRARWAAISLWIGLGAAITYLAVTTEDDFRWGAYLGLIGAGAITSGVFAHYSSAYLFKAINTYNGVSSQRTSRVDLGVAPLRDGAALGLSYSF